MSASPLHVHPKAAPFAMAAGHSRRLQVEAEPPRRQLALRPAAAFSTTNRSVTLRAEPVPPYLPAGANPNPCPEPIPSAPPGPQLRMPLPCTPEGKGKSMGTDNLTRAEQREAKAAPVVRLRVLPKTRSDCLSARATNPGKTEKPRKGDRGRRLAPCPFVSCRHHLYLDVNPESGAIKINFPGLERMELAEPWPRPPQRLRVEGSVREYLTFAGPPRQHAVLDLSLMEDTCSLDVGDRGEKREARNRMIRLEDVGRKMGKLTLERARQLLKHAQGEALAKASDGQEIRPTEDEDPNAAEADANDGC